jgi:drug/metabolite transporter (DMT)-like permease
MQNLTTSECLRGALYGLAAVSIWAGFIVVARLGLRTSLTPWDIAALRFGVAGSLLLPYVMSRGLALERLGWTGLAAIVIGCGAPMVLLANAGLVFAPAAHAGALFPGVMPLMVAILAAAILKEAFTPRKRLGFALIVTGAIGIVWGSGGSIGTAQNVGHVLFLAAGLAWACYTVAMRGARLDGLHAAAIAAVVSLVLYLPAYAYIAGTSILKAQLSDIALQAIVQGLLTAVIALLLYGRMVSILGASSGAAFVALTPAMTALLAIPILDEWPSTIDCIAIALISTGVYVVSGGPLPALRAVPSRAQEHRPALQESGGFGRAELPCLASRETRSQIMNFRIAGLPAEHFAHLFALSDTELAQQGAVRRVADGRSPGYPCRVSLTDSQPGDELLLVNYEHHPVASPYRMRFAIYVRKGEETYDRVGEVPEQLRIRTLAVRAFDADAMMAGWDLVDGQDLEAAIERRLASERAAYLHVHYAAAGCYAARVERA